MLNKNQIPKSYNVVEIFCRTSKHPEINGGFRYEKDAHESINKTLTPLYGKSRGFKVVPVY